MTRHKAGELIQVQPGLGGGYNRTVVRPILSKVQRDHGQTGVDTLICEHERGQAFSLASGSDFPGCAGEPGRPAPERFSLNVMDAYSRMRRCR